MTNCDPTQTLEALSADRRALHRRPEEGWTEFETTWFIAKRLEELGISYTAGIANVDPAKVPGRDAKKVEAALLRARERVPEDFLEKLGGYTGVVAEIDTGREGPLTALRFDIDCVCVEESSSCDHIPAREGFASERPGLMHACGHDAHTAVGLAVAAWVAHHRDELTGRIRLIFQPAEEGTRGAVAMTAKGIVDDVDYFLGSHVGCDAKLGEVLVLKGGFLATSKINIRFTGTPSHAGAKPEDGRSALLAAASAALQISGISRHSQGASRVSVGVLNAGEGRNVTPVHASLQVETRGETDAINDFLEANIRRIVEGESIVYDVKGEMDVVGKGATLPVCEALCERVLETAKEVPGVNAATFWSKPLASEDCTIFMRRVVEKGGEAAFFVWGCENNGHHKADFDINPAVMKIGLGVFCATVRNLNGRKVD